MIIPYLLFVWEYWKYSPKPLSPRTWVYTVDVARVAFYVWLWTSSGSFAREWGMYDVWNFVWDELLWLPNWGRRRRCETVRRPRSHIPKFGFAPSVLLNALLSFFIPSPFLISPLFLQYILLIGYLIHLRCRTQVYQNEYLPLRPRNSPKHLVFVSHYWRCPTYFCEANYEPCTFGWSQSTKPWWTLWPGFRT